MGIVFRQSVKTTIVTSVGALLGALVIYLSTKMIPKPELGFTRNLTSQALVAGQILMFGLHGTLAVYIHRYDDDNRKRKALIGISLLIPFLLLILFSVFYFLLKSWLVHHFQQQDIPFISRYFFWLPVFAFFFIYQIILEQYLVSQLKVALATFMREVVLRVLNIVIIIFFGFGYINFDTLVACTVLIYLLPVLILIFFSVKQKGFGISIDRKAFSKQEYKELLHFTWYHALLGLSTNLLGNLDVLMLAPLGKKGFSDVAVYSVAVFIMSILYIPFRAMMTSTFAVLTRAFRDEDKEKINDVFVRSCINIFIVSVLAAVLIYCNLHNAVAIMKKGYEEIVPIVLILMIGRLVDIATGMNDQVLSISKYYKANFYTSIGLLIMMVILNRIFIPIYGIYGAAWSTSFSLVAYNMLKYVYVYRKLRLQPFSVSTLYVVLAGAITAVIVYWTPHIINPFMDTIIRSIMIVVIYVLLLMLFKPSKDLQEYLRAIKKNKKLF